MSADFNVDEYPKLSKFSDLELNKIAHELIPENCWHEYKILATCIKCKKFEQNFRDYCNNILDSFELIRYADEEFYDWTVSDDHVLFFKRGDSETTVQHNYGAFEKLPRAITETFVLAFSSNKSRLVFKSGETK